MVFVLWFRTLLRRGPLRLTLRFRTLLRLGTWLLDVLRLLTLGLLTLGRGALRLRSRLLDALGHGLRWPFLSGRALDRRLTLRLREGLLSRRRGGSLLRFRVRVLRFIGARVDTLRLLRLGSR